MFYCRVYLQLIPTLTTLVTGSLSRFNQRRKKQLRKSRNILAQLLEVWTVPLALFGFSCSSAFAEDQGIERECQIRAEREFARTSYGFDGAAKFELQKTKVQIVNDVPSENEVQQIALTALYVQAIEDNVHQYTFLIKRDLCLPENKIDLESLVRLKVAEHFAEIYSKINVRARATFKNRFHTFQEATEQETLRKQYLESKLNFDPGARLAQQQLKDFARKKEVTAISQGFFKESSEPSNSETIFDALKSRFLESLKLAEGTLGYGSRYQNPDPASVTQGTSVEIKGIVDSLALLFGEKNLPEFWRERILLETDTDITYFNNGRLTTNQMTTVKFKIGDSYVFARHQYSDFTDKSGTDCNESSHCDKHTFKSAGFRWNARDPLKYRSNVYFEYDLIKLSGNNDFEADVIKQTSANNPHWPLLRRIRPPEKDNPGLLLGYIIRAGFTAQVIESIPQFLPFLDKIYGESKYTFEFFGEGRYFGSTVITDDADSLDLEFGFQIRKPNKIIIGFKTVYSAMMGHDNHNFQSRRNVTTGMLFVTIPLKEPQYLDEATRDAKKYSDELKVTKVDLVTKKYGEDIPIHFNTDETQQKGFETGIDIAAAWGRFIYEVMLMQVHGKNTALDQNVPSYQSGRIAIKYELNPKLRIVVEGLGDNYKSGHFQSGVGFQARPLAGTEHESGVDISLTGMYYFNSDFNALVRGNQVTLLAPDLDIKREWGLMVDVNKPFDIYKLTDWTGIKGEIGFQSRLYMNAMDHGYYSLIFNAGIAHEKLGFRLGASPYGQDGNFGAPSGMNVFAKPQQGKLGPHSEKAMYFTWNMLQAYRFFYPDENKTSKTQLAATNLAPPTKTPKMENEDLPAKNRDNKIVYDRLAEIAGIWESGDRSPEAYELYKTVPYLVLNIAQKKLWTAKWALNNKGLRSPMITFADLLRIYDPGTDYFKLELETDKALESILRNTFSKHPQWKQNIQAVGRETLSEAMHCLGVAMVRDGRVLEGERLIEISRYELPSWFSRFFNHNLYSEWYCQG